MAASLAITVVAVKVAVLGLFAPTQITLDAGDTTIAVTLRDGALWVAGAATPEVALEGRPLVRVTVHDRAGRTRIERRFRGRVTARATTRSIVLVNQLSEEDYITATVASEAGDAPVAALKAQAIVARSFLRAAVARPRHAGLDAAVCDTTHCQLFGGRDGESEAAQVATRATAGHLLAFGGRPVAAYFTAVCGGATADAADVWPDGVRRPFLRSVPCDDCRAAPDYRWQAEIPRAAMGLERLAVIDRGAGGIVRAARLDGAGTARRLGGEALRVELGRRFGWSVVRSARFEVERREEVFHFAGRGSGHGVGLCLAGAAAMARRGADHPAILARYFPGTVIAAPPESPPAAGATVAAPGPPPSRRAR